MSNLMDKFMEFEEQNNLLEKEINGFRYWGYIRLAVCLELEKSVKEFSDPQPNKKSISVWKDIKIKSNIFMNAWVRSPLRRGKKGSVLFISNERRMFIEGLYRPIYFEYIANRMEDPYMIIEPQNLDGEHYKEISHNRETYYIDDLRIKRKIYTALTKRWSYDEDVAFEIRRIIKELSRIFDVELCAEEFIASVFFAYRIYKCTFKYFDKLLKRIKPKCIVEVVSYGEVMMTLNEAAKSNGVPVYELQHGAMGYNHEWYNFLRKHTLPYTPDKILLFSQFWKDTTRFVIPDENVIVTGFPHMDAMMQKFRKKKESKELNILFISAKHIGRSLSKFAIEFATQLERRSIAYKIFYKLHPSECIGWERDLPELYNSKMNIEVIKDAGKLIYEYFSVCDVQIGVNSAALYEGMAFGLRTYIYDIPGAEDFYELYENGYVYLINSVEAFLDGEAHYKCKFGSFWEHNAVENIAKATDINLKP